MSTKVITISLQFGSGGRTIGRKAAEMLGIPCYDQEIIQKLAEEIGYTEDYIREESEYLRKGGLLANILATDRFNPLSEQDKIWIHQTRLIRDISSKEDCVIIGRCADYILRNMENVNCLRVFIHADMDKRAERILNVYGETEIPTKKRLSDKDKRRASYYQFYTDQKWGDVRNYDIALNSGMLGIDTCTELVVEMYKKVMQ